MVSAMTRAAVTVLPLIGSGQQLIDRGEKIVITTGSGLEYCDTGGRVRHENAEQPICSLGNELPAGRRQIGNLGPISGSDREQLAVHAHRSCRAPSGHSAPGSSPIVADRIFPPFRSAQSRLHPNRSAPQHGVLAAGLGQWPRNDTDPMQSDAGGNCNAESVRAGDGKRAIDVEPWSVRDRKRSHDAVHHHDLRICGGGSGRVDRPALDADLCSSGRDDVEVSVHRRMTDSGRSRWSGRDRDDGDGRQRGGPGADQSDRASDRERCGTEAVVHGLPSSTEVVAASRRSLQRLGGSTR